MSLVDVVKETLAVEPQAVEVGDALTLTGVAVSSGLQQTMAPALGATAGRWV